MIKNEKHKAEKVIKKADNIIDNLIQDEDKETYQDGENDIVFSGTLQKALEFLHISDKKELKKEERTHCKECNHKLEKVFSKSGKTFKIKCVYYLCKNYQNERL